jgi:hypothetical protein
LTAHPSRTQKVYTIAKWILVPGIVAFIIFKLFSAYDIDQLIKQHTFSWSAQNLIYLLLALMLMPANVLLEARKWQILVSRFEKVNFKWAFQSVVAGISLSVITPNQLGDFAGRVLKLKELNKFKGALVAVVGHTAQILIVSFVGMLAMINMPFMPQWVSQQGQLLSVLIVIVFVLAIALYYQLGWLDKFVTNTKLKFYTEVFSSYPTSTLTQMLLLSALRYVLYTSQYLLLIYFYDIPILFSGAAKSVASTLCAQIFMPSFLVVELGLRGASALWFLGHYTQNYVAILLAAYSLWMINIMLPALYGLIVVAKTKFVRSKK